MIRINPKVNFEDAEVEENQLNGNQIKKNSQK
jgi:hypothetical protein